MSLLFTRLPGLLRAAPWIAAGLLLAALLVRERVHTVVKRERDLIVQVVTELTAKTTATGSAKPLPIAKAVAAARKLATDHKAAQVALVTQQDATRLATARALAADTARARAVETRYARINQETSHALSSRLSAARADAAAYSRRVRLAAVATVPAAPGRGGGSGVPSLALAAERVAASGGPAVLDADLEICATNTVKAQAWRDWWADVTAVRH